jgi:plastocyanin
MRRLLPALVGIILLAAATASAGTIHNVSISNNMFINSDITIAVGDTVRWTWVNGQHSTTSDTPGLWDSGLLMNPSTFDHVFGSAGDFRYYCTAHGFPGGIGMSGIVRVQGATPTPTATATATITPTPTVTPIRTPEAFHSVAPCRVVDTREPAGPHGGPALAAGASRNFTIAGQCGIPATARSVSFNITITAPTSLGHITLFPAGQPIPLVSNVNFQAGQTRANNAIVKLGTGGAIGVSNGQGTGTVHFIADVNGYFE